MKTLVALLGTLMLSVPIALAQTLTEKPQAAGGDPIGIWEIANGPLWVYTPPELLATISGLQFGGTITGSLTLDRRGAFASDYVTTADVTVIIFGAPLPVQIADTNRTEGTYSVSDTRIILKPSDATMSPDTLGFTATTDSLHLIQKVPLGPYADLVGGLAPGAELPLALIGLAKTGSFPVDEGPLTADFTGDGVVDFTDFLAFASGFGKAAGESGYDAKMDLDASGRIDFTDFLAFASQFGRRS